MSDGSAITGRQPVQEGPGGPRWPSLAEALASSTADVLHGPTGRAVAYRSGGDWYVDEAAVLYEQADDWRSRLDDERIRLLVLRLVHEVGPIQLADLYAAATLLGLAGLPDLASLDQGRIWPSGTDGSPRPAPHPIYEPSAKVCFLPGRQPSRPFSMPWTRLGMCWSPG